MTEKEYKELLELLAWAKTVDVAEEQRKAGLDGTFGDLRRWWSKRNGEQ